jgi:hypothetical protein
MVTDEGRPASFWSVLQEVQEGLQVSYQIPQQSSDLVFALSHNNKILVCVSM